MSDGCQGWRRMLARSADNELTPTELGALRNHLAYCSNCRLATESDYVLRDVLRQQAGSLGAEAGQAFDDRVVAEFLATPRVLRPVGWRERLQQQLARVPIEYVSQVAGGALAAACVTALCLFPTLHPHLGRSPNPSGSVAGPAAGVAVRATLPVSLGSLLSSPSPRAALLWQPPVSHHHPASLGILDLAPRLPTFRSHPVRPSNSSGRPEQRSSLFSSSNVG